MRVLIAPQEFKGTLTAVQAASAIAEGVRQALTDADIDALPMADGGPGTVDAVVAARNGRAVTTTVRDPLGRPVEAGWGIVDGTEAIIEMAAAAGLTLLADAERDPRLTATFGVGQLMLAALDAGCKRIVVGLGGSATNDAGAGMAQALGARLLDAAGRDLPPGGAALASLDRINLSGLDERLRACEIVAAADVTNPLCGPHGASLVYGPQKGADAGAARELDAALRRFAEVVQRDLGVSVLDEPGAGAAGGLGAGLIAFCRARIQPGAMVVAGIVGLRERIRGANLVLTGEGSLDRQTGFGKTVAGVARIAGEEGVPVLALAGVLGEGWETVLAPGVAGVEPIVPSLASPEEALVRPAALLATAAARAVSAWISMAAIAKRND
ncbi:MAG: glycerate kinase [Dehalococcoidia bacterium]